MVVPRLETISVYNPTISTTWRWSTYGHESIDTNTMPITMAYLIRNAIRNAVKTPPARTPTQSYGDVSAR